MRKAKFMILRKGASKLYYYRVGTTLKEATIKKNSNND